MNSHHIGISPGAGDPKSSQAILVQLKGEEKRLQMMVFMRYTGKKQTWNVVSSKSFFSLHLLSNCTMHLCIFPSCLCPCVHLLPLAPTNPFSISLCKKSLHILQMGHTKSVTPQIKTKRALSSAVVCTPVLSQIETYGVQLHWCCLKIPFCFSF